MSHVRIASPKPLLLHQLLSVYFTGANGRFLYRSRTWFLHVYIGSYILSSLLKCYKVCASILQKSPSLSHHSPLLTLCPLLPLSPIRPDGEPCCTYLRLVGQVVVGYCAPTRNLASSKPHQTPRLCWKPPAAVRGFQQ